MRSRGVLAAICVLVALGLLLCAGRESLAKQPVRAPESARPARSAQPISRGPEGGPSADRRAPATESRPARQNPAGDGPAGASQADRRAPAAQSRPARGEAVGRGPLSRPSRQRPTERGAPAGRRALGEGRPAEPPGRRIAPLNKPANDPRAPWHPPRAPGPRETVGTDAVRPHPRPNPVDRGPLSRPDYQRPTPWSTTPDPRGSESAGWSDGAGSQVQHGDLASPPEGENTHRGVKGSVEPPPRPGRAFEHGAATHPMIGSDGGYVPATPEKRPVYGGEPAEAADYPPPARALAGDETGSGTRSGTEPSRLPAGASDGTFGRRSTAIGGEDPVTLDGAGRLRTQTPS